MWRVDGANLTMTVGDYGLELPVTVNGPEEFTLSDSLKFQFKRGDSVVVEKVYSQIVGNTVNLEFTAEESATLTAGVYLYSLDWYQDGNFMCNIIDFGTLRVVSKA